MQTNTELFLKELSDSELLFDTKEAIRNEREAISIVVKYLKEIKARELYLKHACSSLFQFATEKLGYCAASAQARINAVELVIAVPEVEHKIESGELSLTAASKVQTFFRAEKKAKKSYSKKDKLEVLELCFDKSTREVERELAKRNPEVARFETTKPVGESRFELKFTITEELEAKIRKLKGLLAHSQPNMKTEELLEALVELALDKFDPARKAERSLKAREMKHKASSAGRYTTAKVAKSTRAHEVQRVDANEAFRAHEATSPSTYPTSTSAVARAKDVLPTTRYIPADVRHQVWQRNGGGGCEFVSQSGERCSSQYALQLDHVVGFARGGTHEIENLRILCASHNRFVWRSQTVIREAVLEYRAA